MSLRVLIADDQAVIRSGLRRILDVDGEIEVVGEAVDGVAAIDISDLVAFHRRHGRKATITAVSPPGRFGALEFNGDLVESFREKPDGDGGMINGGFFVADPSVLDLIEGDETLWEQGPLEQLAASGELAAYRHSGFWQPMDTLRDKLHLEELWRDGAPWKCW